MSEEKDNLAESLIELNRLAYKYDFNTEDKLLLMERCLLLGDMCAFLQEMGLWRELEVIHEKHLKKFEKEVLKLL